MKKMILAIAILFSVSSFSAVHTYYFKIQGVTDYAQAKNTIDQMRSILGIKMFVFDDVTDTFKTVSDWTYNWSDMAEDLAAASIFLDGPVEHIFSE